jgi:hypothetical protein
MSTWSQSTKINITRKGHVNMASPRNMDELKRAITYIELLTRSFETMKLLHYLLLSKPRTRFYLLWKFNFRNTISSPVSTLRLLLLSPLNSLVRSACPAYEPSTTMTQQTLLLSQAHTYTHTHTDTHKHAPKQRSPAEKLRGSPLVAQLLDSSVYELSKI